MSEDQSNSPTWENVISDFMLKKNNSDEEKYIKEVVEADTLWMSYPLSSGEILICYPEGTEITPGGFLRIVINSNCYNICRMETCSIRLLLPDGWSTTGSPEKIVRKSPGAAEFILHAENLTNAVTYIPVEIRTSGRNLPEMFCVPIQTKDAVEPNLGGVFKQEMQRSLVMGRRKQKLKI